MDMTTKLWKWFPPVTKNLKMAIAHAVPMTTSSSRDSLPYLSLTSKAFFICLLILCLLQMQMQKQVQRVQMMMKAMLPTTIPTHVVAGRSSTAGIITNIRKDNVKIISEVTWNIMVQGEDCQLGQEAYTGIHTQPFKITSLLVSEYSHGCLFSKPLRQKGVGKEATRYKHYEKQQTNTRDLSKS